MKPVTLYIDGINSFSEAQEIDFERAARERIFCITGETGSGKTTILDCILLALYRSSSDRGSKLENYINLKRESAEIAFTFELDGRLYTMRRTLSRKTGKNSAALYEKGSLVAEGNAAFERVESVIGLTREEFTKVVVLQQGAFAQFLSATKKERNDIVGKLFNLERYYGVAPRLRARIDALKNEESRLSFGLEQYAGVDEAAVKTLRAEVNAQAQTVLNLKAAAEQSEKNRAAVKEQRRLYLEQLSVLAEVKEKEAETARLSGEEQAAQARLAALTPTPEAIQAEDEKIKTLIGRKELIADALSRVQSVKEKEAACSALIDRYKQSNAEAQAQEQAATEQNAIATAATETLKPFFEADKDLAAEDADGKLTAIAENRRQRAEAAQKLSIERQTLCNELAVKQRQAQTKQAEALTLDAAARQAQADLAAAEAALNVAKSALERWQTRHAAASVRQTLNPGDTCPVCGGAFHGGGEAHAAEAHGEVEAVQAAETARQHAQERFAAAKSVAASAAQAAELLSGAADEAAKRLNGLAKIEDAAALGAEAERFAAAAAKAATAKAAASKAKTAETLAKKYREQAELIMAEGKRVRAELDAEKQKLAAAAGDGDPAELMVVVRQELAALENTKTQREAAINAAGAQVNALRAALSAGLGGLTALRTRIKPTAEVTEEQAADAEAAYKARTAELEAAAEKLASDKTTLLDREVALSKTASLKASLDSLNAEIKRHETLYGVMFSGRTNVWAEFVAAEYIKDFTRAASGVLNDLTDGKYTLTYEEAEGEFFVRDYLSGNEPRSSRTLSGGETFLASLSLAMAISAEIAKSRDFDFFFIDEGFGTLDEKTIDTVMDALTALSRETMVGVITHRTELKERMPSLIRVTAPTESSGSRIFYE